MDGSRVTVIGLGRMGAAMAGTLARAGFDLTVYNRTRQAALDVAATTGAAVADTPRTAAAAADIIVSSLADDAAVRAVYFGDSGIAAGVRPDVIVLETSTIDPGVVAEIGELLDTTGAHLFDAPVSGSVSLVEQGALTVMAGGDKQVIDRAMPVLDALAAKVFHVGGRGAGATTKLAVNALVHDINGALSEALVLAEKAGVDRATAYEVFAAGAGGAPFVQYKKAAFADPDGTPVAFSLDLVAKDLELITGLGDRVGVAMPVTQAGLELTRQAIAAGLGDYDMSALAVWLRGDV